MDNKRLYLNGSEKVTYFSKGEHSRLYRYKNEYLIQVYNNIDEYSLEFIDELSSRQQYIKYTDLPLANVFYKNKFIGGLVKYYLSCNNIEVLRYIKNYDLTSKMLIQTISSLKELTNNYIYPMDLDETNILIDLINNSIHLIDLTEDGVELDKKRNIKLEKRIYTLFKNVLLYILFKEYNPLLNCEPILEKYHVKNEYIDIFSKKEYDYDFFEEFIQYTKKL